MSAPHPLHLLLKQDWDLSYFWLVQSQILYKQSGTEGGKKQVHQNIWHLFWNQQYLSRHHTQVALGH